MRHTHDACIQNLGVINQNNLYLLGIDVHSSRDDQEPISIREKQIAVLIEVPEVTRGVQFEWLGSKTALLVNFWGTA